MYKLTHTYEDFDGRNRTEDFYFNLSDADMKEIHYVDLAGEWTRLNELGDKRAMINGFKDLIVSAYGIKSPDGRVFDRSPEVRKNFEYSAAFGSILWEILGDMDRSQEFFVNVVPSKYKESARTMFTTKKAEVMAELGIVEDSSGVVIDIDAANATDVSG